MSALSVKFIQFNNIRHWISSAWELNHESEISKGVTFSLVYFKVDINKVHICASQGLRKGFS